MKLSKVHFVAIAFLMAGPVQAGDHDHHHHQAAPAAEKSKPLHDESIYNLNSSLLDEDGKVFQLEKYRGKPVVISMAYTSCVYTCPLILAQMQQLEKALAEQGKKDVRFVLVSFDPAQDTPKVLKDYAKKKKLSTQWNLLTSKSDKEPREIASVLGIKYSKVEGGDYDHSFIITVLDAEGVPRGRQVGAAGNPKDLIKFIP
ncbi:SCO family protein [Bdellovibrio bacteriovorus]|uniref:SCO family protein n=1 Tax=Bdellovibrio bacteriovorus TaxID=959 RepID=UPI003CFBE724